MITSRSLYAIFDRVTMEASQPFVAANDAHAHRLYKVALRDEINQNDFRLYRIADLLEEGLHLAIPKEPVEVLINNMEV